MTRPAAGEWWCPGSWRGRDPDGRDTYAGCDGDPACGVCKGRSMSEALEGRVSHGSWWEREQNTHRGRMLRGWANLAASRYGRPVYLVGGALKDSWIRDLDVRVVLSRSEFEERFGKLGPHDASHGGNGYCLRLEEQDAERRWHVEVAKMNRQGANNTHLPVDFQVEHLREATAYLREPRVRLDDLPGLTAPWDD